ncbi:MAG: signal peptidase I [Lachnospiraceae bacterium]|jgi:signal peptidase I|nr:signal peptidase I [Lachnospiraceae bacterium]MDD6451342.1 signal peptidase I [Lachnospiraceae bacterium]
MEKIKTNIEKWKKRRHDSLNFRRRKRHVELARVKAVAKNALSYLLVIFLALILVLAFFYRVKVLGPSMESTVHSGDSVLVDRIRYKISGPHRGDIVAFLPNGDREAEISIKRVIGLPGEKIQIKNGALYINNKVYNSDISNETINHAGLAENELKLGKGEYFLLGDNRNNSEDSRYESIGKVTRKELIGKVWLNVTFSNFGLME